MWKQSKKSTPSGISKEYSTCSLNNWYIWYILSIEYIIYLKKKIIEYIEEKNCLYMRSNGIYYMNVHI